MAKNILIIGGSYFVGKVFVEDLLRERTDHIYVLNRGNHPLRREGVTEIVCDRHDYNLKTAIPQLSWDTVIDFCGYTPLDIAQLMLAIPNELIKQYIFISTASIYDETTDLPVKEDSPRLEGPQPELGPAAEYGFNKWQAELKLADICRKSNIPYTCLRPTVIYGKYNYAPRESYFFDLISKGESVVLPKNELALFQFVSVWDVARIIRLCIGNPAVYNRSFNLAGEELVGYQRFIQVLQDIIGIKVSIYTLESKEIDEQQIPLPFPLEQHLIYSGSLIEHVLEFKYMSFVEGMKRTYEWYLNRGV